MGKAELGYDPIPVVEYDRMKGGTEDGLHLYVFGHGLLVARLTPSVAGPVTRDGEGMILTAYVDGYEVESDDNDGLVSRAASLEIMGDQKMMDSGDRSTKRLAIRGRGNELSYATKGELPPEVAEFVGEILLEFDDTSQFEELPEFNHVKGDKGKPETVTSAGAY